MIHIAVLQDPSSHSKHEIISVLERAKMQAHCFSWCDSIENLADFAGFILIGHDWENDSPSFSIADSVLETIKKQSTLGKPILGIGKGARLLVAQGLVPGLDQNKIGVSLADNQRPGFYQATVRVRLASGYQWNAFTRRLAPKAIYQMPISHDKGRFVLSSVLLEELKRNGLSVLQYCDERGMIHDEFPVNPNGSVHNIAAVANKPGNVMAMLPHPEATLAGDAIFHSMREYIANGCQAKPLTLDFLPRASLNW